jgi:hypothetical protein
LLTEYLLAKITLIIPVTLAWGYYSDTLLGITDPDYCVLKFTAANGRMYENFHSYDFKV